MWLLCPSVIGAWCRCLLAACFRHLFLVAVCGGTIVVFYCGSSLWPLADPQSDYPHLHQHLAKTFTIKTEGCTIPALQPIDDNIRGIISRRNKQEIPKPCFNANVSLLESNATHIWIQRENLPHYNATEDASVYCCYQAFSRARGAATKYSDRVHYDTCSWFTSHIRVANEFVAVTCYHEDIIYEQYYAFVPIKPLLTKAQSSSAYNVVIMGIDGVSRMNFYRTMPKTLTFLKNKGAIELLGYNKIGDNSFPNLIPLLLGISMKEVNGSCWSKTKGPVEECSFIWEWFRDVGYHTAYGEDVIIRMNIYNYVKRDYATPPTDYYLQTFLQETKKYIANYKDANYYLCIGDKYFYKFLLDYAMSLMLTLRASKFFGFFWETSMTHDYLAFPRIMDDSYEQALKRLDSSNYLERTVLIVMSDHGIRWGPFRLTKQGRLEGHLPFVYILLPQSFRRSYSLAYDNLKINSQRLSTPYDMHETLSDLVVVEAINNANIKFKSQEAYSQRRGISLFLPIPSNRTCSAAGIDEYWCTCRRSVKLSALGEEGRAAGAQLVRHVNALVRGHAQCAPLALAEVLELAEQLAGDPGQRETGWRELTVLVRVAPGGGLFEGTLRLYIRSWTLIGPVSRLNLYGDQSRCISHQHLKLYCYCR